MLFYHKRAVRRIDRNEEEITKSICYILQFMAMAILSSNLVNNLSEGIHSIKCKFGQNDKKCEKCESKYKYCDCFLEYANFKDDLIKYKCLCCNEIYQQMFDKKLKE